MGCCGNSRRKQWAADVEFSKPNADKAKTARTLHVFELGADRSALWSSVRIQTGKLENSEGNVM